MKRNRKQNSYFGPGRICRLVMITILLMAPAGLSAAQSSLNKAAVLKSDEPIHITSDRMVVSQKTRTIAFEGHVVVKQGKLTITGKRLTIYAAKAGKLKKKDIVEQIDRIEIVGDVRVAQEDKVATAGKAVFYNHSQKIILSDHPRIIQGKDQIQGALITLYLQEERSVIEGSDQQPVEAVLHPKSGGGSK